MVAKKIVVGLSCAVIVSAGILVALLGQAQITPTEQSIKKTDHTQPKPKATVAPIIEKKYDLYTNVPQDLPLLSILEISETSEKMKKSIDEILEQAGGFLLLKKAEKNKVIIILPNSISGTNTYMRHNLELVELSQTPDSEILKTINPMGYNGYEGETSNAIAIDSKRDDYWKYDKSTEPYRPLKHTIYDENGKTKYTEQWDYSQKNPLKYVMKDSKGNIISVFKETLEDDINLRQEHVFYDENGNTAMSLSINYDGANISRLTYYNSYDIPMSTTIITEYSDDGLKVKESIYTSSYELLGTVICEYEENLRKTIRLMSSEEKEIKKISS